MSNFRNSLDARLKKAATLRPSADPAAMPMLAESSATPASSGVLEDVVLGGINKSHNLDKPTWLMDQMLSDPRFADASNMIENLSGELSMTIVREFIESHPDERKEELCEIMVRCIIQEISRPENPTTFDKFGDETSLDGSTIRAAMEILVKIEVKSLRIRRMKGPVSET
jgi:hypothetical protein